MMESSMNFTLGLSQGVAWPWPIAVYLFFAGISGGALAVALCLNFFKHKQQDTPLLKAASSIGLVTILAGMLCLVLDLTNPLFFWRILVFYNPTSVMSLGVMALLFYIPLTAVLTLVVFRGSLCRCACLGWLEPLAAYCARYRRVLEAVVFVLALTICAYTGFLISALIRFPIINTSVLPALFVASGLSAGAAASKLVAVGCFGEDRHSADMHVLHGAEWPIMAVEALCIFMIAVALISGNAAAQHAAQAFVSGGWAVLFWVGVVGIGFALPVVLNLLVGKSLRECVCSFWVAGAASVVGMMCLRLFILYAGQLYSI